MCFLIGTSGDSLVFYLLVATSNDGNNTSTYSNFTVTGLTDPTVTWASATGDGFTNDTISVPVANLAMIKVEGTLGKDPVSFAADTAKNGWAMVSYAAIPEPTTATLSLPTPASPAARRRRR